MSDGDEEEERERPRKERKRLTPKDRYYGKLPAKTLDGGDDLRSYQRIGRVLQLNVHLSPMVRAILGRDRPPRVAVLFDEMVASYLEKPGPLDKSLLPTEEELAEMLEKTETSAMASDPTVLPDKNLPDAALALWMLDRMQDSEKFLAIIQVARIKGRQHVLDTPDYVAQHKGRLKKLYEGDDEDPFEVPPAPVGKIEAIIKRDMISGVEEFMEKAIEAYIEKHPMKTQGLPNEWQSTLEAARAEVEGKTSGVFEPGFVAGLAMSAREEIDRRHEAEKGREAGRDGRDE